MATDPERRELSFNSLEEIIAEVDQLTSGKVRTTGNHSFGAILHHLALSQDVSTGRATPPPPPFFLKLMLPLMRKMVINSKPIKPGAKLPKRAEAFFWPDKEFDIATEAAYYRESTAYYLSNGPAEKHAFFGPLTRQQSDELNCRHAALHLSFVHPV